jgi:DNA-binding transcriptional ArsR family regulator
MSAGELAARFDQSASTMSGHFSVLKDADLVQAERNGTTIMYRLNVSVLEEALLGLLDAFKIKPKAKKR